MLKGLFSLVRNLKGLHLAIIALAMISIAAPTEAFAQKGGSSGRSSSGSRPSSSPRSGSSSSSKPSSSGWGGKSAAGASKSSSGSGKSAATQPASKPSSPAASPNSGSSSKPSSSTASKPSSSGGSSWGSKSSTPTTTAAKPANKAEAALYEQTKKQGTTYASREEAVTAFKASQSEQVKKQYTSSFSNEPSSRPSYIPPTYVPPGYSQPVKVVYRSDLGGYGWFNSALNTYVLYDILTDDRSPVIASHMANSGYTYAPSSGGGHFFLIFIIVIVLVAVVFGFIVVLKSQSRFKEQERKIARVPVSPYKPASIATDRRNSMSNKDAAIADAAWEKQNVMLKPSQHTSNQGENKDGRDMKTSDPEFWRDIRPKSIVTLTDLSALEESLKEGRGADGEEYTVEWVYQIDEISKKAEWIFIKMNSVQDEIVYLMAMIVDGNFAIYSYYPAGGYEPSSRSEAVANGQQWLFVEPDDLNIPDPLKLEYTDHFNFTLSDDAGTETEVTYQKKSFGVMQGMGYRNPPEGRMLVTIAMYATSTQCHSPEALVLEMGAPDNDQGGLIGLYLGEPIQPSEISVHHA